MRLSSPDDEPVLKLVETRLRSRATQQGTALHGPEAAAAILHELIGMSDREEFVALLLDTRHRVTRVHKVSRGNLGSTQVHPREVFKAAILANASALVVGHNHPSGDPQESMDDKNVTQRLREAGKLLGIEVLDAIIVTPQGVYFTASAGTLGQVRPLRAKEVADGP